MTVIYYTLHIVRFKYHYYLTTVKNKMKDIRILKICLSYFHKDNVLTLCYLDFKSQKLILYFVEEKRCF